MKPKFRQLILVAMACFAYTGIASAAESNTVEKIGERYYQQTCAKCHEVGIGPEMKGKYPESVYKVFVRNGSNAMPAFRVTDIDDKTLESLAKYLANYPKGK